jgi:anthranilate phosphoribosyltransferase
MACQQEHLRSTLERVTNGGSLPWQQAEAMVDALMETDLEDPRFAALAAGLLCAIKTRGESVEEIVGAARCLQKRQLGLAMAVAGEPLLDTCGTGGDGAHLINVSTLAALVAASLGVRVAKHGNRSISSACGSADLLEAMGYPLLESPEQVSANVARGGFGFLFAPHFHPALRRLAGLRRTLGVRTLFNLLGPLVNPAGVTHQVIGIYARDMLVPMAWAALRLGLSKTLIVHGEGGLDEISPCGTTWVAQSEHGRDGVHEWEWTPESFGAPRVPLEALRGGDAQQNSRMARDLLAGGRAEVAAAVAMNAAAAIWLAKQEKDLRQAYARCYDALRGGEVGRYFERCKDQALAAD